MSKDNKTKKKFDRIIKVCITAEDAPYAPKNQLGEYTVERWTWADKQNASQKATTEIDVKRGIVSWDTVKYYIWMLLYSVKKMPSKSEWNESTVTALDPDVGDALRLACLEVNTLSKDAKRNFLGQLNSGAPITGTQPIGHAKLSDVSQAPGV